MNIEYEIRILEIDVENIKAKLESLKAIKQGEYNQTRLIYDFHPALPHKWIRLRNNGKKLP